MNVNFPESKSNSLVDQIETHIIEYIKLNNLRAGDALPREVELAEKFGVARGVMREALSRLKMLGIIDSRTNRGIVISEPNIFVALEKVAYPNLIGVPKLIALLEFRIALEIGMCKSIIDNVTEKDLEELAEIIKLEDVLDNNDLQLQTGLNFHFKLYSITNNPLIFDFQKIIRPLIVAVKFNFSDEINQISQANNGKMNITTHHDILEAIRSKDLNKLRKSMEGHFVVFKELVKRYKSGSLTHLSS